MCVPGPYSVCPGLQPTSCWKLTHPRVRRQPPEGLERERERERALGRGQDPERTRGCGTLRWGSVSASRALLPGGRKGRSVPGPPRLPALFFLSWEPHPQDPNPFFTPGHSGDPSPMTPSPFSRSSAPDPPPLPRYFFYLALFRHSPRAPKMRPNLRTHACRVPAPAWGFPLPERPPGSPPLGAHSRSFTWIPPSVFSPRPRPCSPFTHTRSRSAASRAAQAPLSASAAHARRCSSSSSRVDSAATASQRARASVGAAGAVRLETRLPTPRAPASELIVCLLLVCCALFELNLCAVYLDLTYHLHGIS